MNDKKKQAFEQLFSTLDGRHEINGAVLAAENGRILYQGSFGTAELETNRMLNDQSVFELASVSKPFTALGVIILEQEGKLRYGGFLIFLTRALPFGIYFIIRQGCRTI